MDTEYGAWKNDPQPENLGKLVDAAKGNIDKALRMYVGNDDKAARSHAKVLAVKAFKSYDPSKNTKLRTHFLTQLQPLRRFAASRRMVFNVPEVVQQDMAGIGAAKRELIDALDREPTDAELADHTGLSQGRIQKLRQRQFAMSEGGRLNEEGEIFQDTTQVPGDLDTWTDYVYHDLSPVDRKIYEWRTGYNGRKKLTNNQIAAKLRLTPGAVTQRADKIARKIEEGLDLAS
jgi:DNA-directed RNA polymerase specialized sigma subunit